MRGCLKFALRRAKSNVDRWGSSGHPAVNLQFFFVHWRRAMSSFLKTHVSKPQIGKRTLKVIKVSTPVGVSAQTRDSIVAKLEKKAYRDAYVEANLMQGLAHQIRVNRSMRKWSQADLAEHTGGKTKQEVISRLEDPAYGRYTIKTLLKLAAAFDVALMVKFVPFSKFLIETSDKSESGLMAIPFPAEDLYLRQATVTLTMHETRYIGIENVKNTSLPIAESGVVVGFSSIKSLSTDLANRFLKITNVLDVEEYHHV